MAAAPEAVCPDSYPQILCIEDSVLLIDKGNVDAGVDCLLTSCGPEARRCALQCDDLRENPENEIVSCIIDCIESPSMPVSPGAPALLVW